MTTQPDDWTERRADARRNHERVLAAAIEVFTEQGLSATIPEIAARAGVGKATVYRSYATKADLIRAIAQLHIDWLEDQISAAHAHPDAFAGLELFVTSIMARLASDRLMVEIFSSLQESGTSIEEASEHEVHAEKMRLLLGRAAAAGQVRDDVTEMDFKVLVGGTAHALIDQKITDPDLWQRYARLSLNALRP